MTTALAVIFAGVLHATWNAIAKGASDRWASFALIGTGQAIVIVPLLGLVPFPAAGAWPWLLGSVALHLVYMGLLLTSYQLGDFSQVYPLARGSAPLIVALVAATTLGERLSLLQLGGVAAICGGLAVLAFTSSGKREPGARNGHLVSGNDQTVSEGVRNAREDVRSVRHAQGTDANAAGGVVLARDEGRSPGADQGGGRLPGVAQEVAPEVAQDERRACEEERGAQSSSGFAAGAPGTTDETWVAQRFGGELAGAQPPLEDRQGAQRTDSVARAGGRRAVAAQGGRQTTEAGRQKSNANRGQEHEAGAGHGRRRTVAADHDERRAPTADHDKRRAPAADHVERRAPAAKDDERWATGPGMKERSTTGAGLEERSTTGAALEERKATAAGLDGRRERAAAESGRREGAPGDAGRREGAAADAGRRNRSPRAVVAALATGVSIASYTVLDGIGVRAAHGAAGYSGWLFALEAPLIVVFVLALRGRRTLSGLSVRTWVMGFAGGVLSMAGYGIVLWAQTRGALAAVAALRETGVIAGAVIGAVFFAERMGARRIAAACVVAAGVVLITGT